MTLKTNALPFIAVTWVSPVTVVAAVSHYLVEFFCSLLLLLPLVSIWSCGSFIARLVTYRFLYFRLLRLSAEVLMWLSVWSKVQMICIWCS